MWICFNDAFVSAVADPKNPGTLKVRARKREHLETLFPGVEIHELAQHRLPLPGVRQRSWISPTSWLDARAMAIDYGNFKNSVKDKKLHDLYAGFWHDHYQYQRAP